jgi:hypothetical protein
MTFPLTALIETNWEALQNVDKAGNVERAQLMAIQVAVVEVTACAERALNFMHTGNPAVIKTSVMNPLWIGRAIINDGLPSFNSSIVKARFKETVNVFFDLWPYDDIRNMPKSTAERSLRYRYNDQVASVSYLPFIINHYYLRL